MLSRDERRRFDEIARRIDQEPPEMYMHPAPNPATTAAISMRLAAFGSLVVGVIGLVTGIVSRDLVVLVLVGGVPNVAAIILLDVAGPTRQTSAPPVEPGVRRREPSMSTLRQFWLWLTTCADEGCGNHPVHLGWCCEHALPYDPGPDEYWG